MKLNIISSEKEFIFLLNSNGRMKKYKVDEGSVENIMSDCYIPTAQVLSLPLLFDAPWQISLVLGKCKLVLGPKCQKK